MRRMTMTEKWRDPWFRRLSPAAKLLWMYLCDICDNAGFVQIDTDLFCMETGLSKAMANKAWLELQAGMDVNQEQGMAWLVRFLEVQKCLPLSEACHPHKKIKERLMQMVEFSPNIQIVLDGKRPIKAGSSTLPTTLPGRVKDKDKEEEEDKDKEEYGEFGLVRLTKDELEKLVAKQGKERVDVAIELLDNAIKAKGYQYKSHYATMKAGGWIWGEVDKFLRDENLRRAAEEAKRRAESYDPLAPI